MIGDCKVVIDKLKLCYKRDNENQFWKMMAEQPDHLIIGDKFYSGDQEKSFYSFAENGLL